MGAQHPRIKELRRQLGRRSSSSSFVVLEGPRTLGEALDVGMTLETVLIPESGADAESVTAVRSRLAGEVETLVARDHVFERLAPTVTPQPMLAIAARPLPELPHELGTDDIVLVLIDVADPGNIGTLIRVADATATRCVVVVGGADPWGDKSIRASAGSILRVPVVSANDVGEVVSLPPSGRRSGRGPATFAGGWPTTAGCCDPRLPYCSAPKPMAFPMASTSSSTPSSISKCRAGSSRSTWPWPARCWPSRPGARAESAYDSSQATRSASSG